MFYEVLQFLWGGKLVRTYFDSFWNLNDIILIVVYLVYMTLAYIHHFVDDYAEHAATSTL